MSLQLPSLDSRTYADLVAEAKQRIPRYLPEWTDLNDSDPGIALVQLFAWMTEATLYELNRAPDVLRLKLLRLLGFSSAQAQPAKTELAFTLSAGKSTATIPTGTRVAVAGAAFPDGSPIVFETDASVVALGAALTAVASMVNGVVNRFFDPSQPQAGLFAPFPAVATAADNAALYLAFDSTNPFPKADVDLAFFLNDAPGDHPSRTCVLGAQLIPPATWVWEYFDAGLSAWRPVTLLADETAALYRSGHVRFNFPLAPLPSAVLLGMTAFWVRARIVSAHFEDAPQLLTVTTNTAPASQAITATNETLGASDGTPSQQFSVAHANVLPDTLVITVDEGTGIPEAWTQVADFWGSGPDSKVYTLDSSSHTIVFGDGVFGSIPLANPTNQNNIVASTYRYGGGSLGNVAAEAITSIQSYVAYVDSVKNPVPAIGGADAETPQAISLRAAHAVKSTNRAVTSEDFEALALQTPGAFIARAHAMPLFHPGYPGIPVPGCVTVVVVPDFDDKTRPPQPNQTTLSAVCSWLDAHRLASVELHVVGPTYRTLTFSMTAYCKPAADLAAVTRAIQSALHNLYDPVRPEDSSAESGLLSEDEPGTGDFGWPWGATAYSAVAFAKAMNVNDVVRIADFVMSVDGNPLPNFGDAALAPAELVWVAPDGITIVPRYDGAP